MPPLSLAIVAASTIIAIELFLRLPFWDSAQLMLKTSRKASYILSSRQISDHWKEKVLLRYSCILAGESLRLAAMFFFVGLGVAAFVITSDFLLKPLVPTLQVLTDWRGLIVASVIALLYWQLRKRIVR